MDPEYLTLVNELREPLKQYGILADDLDTKTLKKCRIILAAIKDIKAERMIHEEALKPLQINFMTIERRTGINHKSLSENDVYNQIITSDKTEKEEKTDKRIASLSLELAKYKKMEADVDDVKKQQLALNKKYAEAEQEKTDLKREWGITQESLQQANEKIDKLEKENMKLRHIIESYSGMYPGSSN